MEKINQTNYEAFFLDYVEGNLTAVQEKELHDFLLKNPELKTELEEFEAIILDEEVVVNTDLKNTLKREESTTLPLVDYLMIAEVEGTITTKEKAQLSAMVQENPNLINDLSIYHKVKLTDESIISFPRKSTLLQKERKTIVWWQYSAAVAAAILVLFFWNGSSELYYSPRSVSYAEVKDEVDTDNQLAFIVEREEVFIQEDKPLETQLSEGGGLTPKKSKGVIVKKEQKEKKVRKIEKKPSNQFANNKVETKTPKSDENPPIYTNDKDQFADVTIPAIVKEETDNFVPLKEFAKERIKTDVLKGKTFSETIIDELEEASNEKVSFKREKNQDGDTQKFAINIGKFSLSRNK